MSATAKRTPLRASKRQKTPSKRERKAADNPAPPPEVSRCASELGKAGAKARWAGHVKTAKVSRAEADERSNAATIAAIRRAAATTTAQATPVRVDVRPVDEPLPVDALGRAMSVGEAMKSIRAPLALLAANPSTRAPLSLDAVNDALWHPGATIRAEDGRLDLKATGMLVGATHEDIDGGQPAAWLYAARGPVSDPRLVEIFRSHNGTVYYGATAPNRLPPRDVVSLRVAPMKRAAASFILDAADELGVAVEIAERANIQARDSVYAIFPSTGTRGQWQLSRFTAGEGPTWHQEGPDKIALVELAIGQMPRVVLVPGAVDAAVLMAVTEPLTTTASGGSKSAEGRAGMQTEQVPDTVTRKLDPEEIEEERALDKRREHESWMHSIVVRAVSRWLGESKQNMTAARAWLDTGQGIEKIEREIEALYDKEKESAEAEEHAEKAGASLDDFYFDPRAMEAAIKRRVKEADDAKGSARAKGEAREKYARDILARYASEIAELRAQIRAKQDEGGRPETQWRFDREIRAAADAESESRTQLEAAAKQKADARSDHRFDYAKTQHDQAKTKLRAALAMLVTAPAARHETSLESAKASAIAALRYMEFMVDGPVLDLDIRAEASRLREDDPVLTSPRSTSSDVAEFASEVAGIIKRSEEWLASEAKERDYRSASIVVTPHSLGKSWRVRKDNKGFLTHWFRGQAMPETFDSPREAFRSAWRKGLRVDPREAFSLHEQSQGRGETPKPAPVAAEPEPRPMAAPVDEFGDADVILAHSPEEGTTIRTKPNDRSHNETIKSLGMAFKWWAEGGRWYRQKSRGAAEPSIPLRVIAERLRAKGVRVRVSALEDVSPARAASAKRDATEQRAAYLRKRAESKLAKASAESAKAQALSDRIPMGEPVKSWHHSARKHRADILRFERAMDKTMQARRDASKAVARAESAEEAAKAAREKSAADSWAEPLIKPLGEALLTLKRSVGATAIKLHSKKKDEAVWTVSLAKDYQGFGAAIVVRLSYAGGWLSALDNETQGREGFFWNDRIGSADQAPAIVESLAKAIAAKRNVELKAVEPKKSKAKPAKPAEEGALAALPFFARNILSSLDNAAVRAAYGASSRWEVRPSPQMDLRAFPDGPSTINATAALSAFATFSDAGRVELIIAPARDEARQKGWTILVAQESGKAETTPGEAWVAEAKERGKQVAADVLRDVDRMRSAAAERQSDMLLASASWANWPPKAPGSTPIKPTEQEIEFGRPDTVSNATWAVALAVREARRLASSVRRTVELQKARGLSSAELEGDAGTIRSALHGIEVAATSGVTFGGASRTERHAVSGWTGHMPEHESFMRAARNAVTVWQIRHGIGALVAHPDGLPRIV